MAVGPDLLKAAEANDPAAIDMVSIWGLGYQAELGSCLAPGLWMHGGAQRVLEQSSPGVLSTILRRATPTRARWTRPPPSKCRPR